MNKTPLLLLCSFASLTSCATADFTSYVGAQRDWPTSSGAFVKNIGGADGHYVLPVYFGLPNKPYRVIGYVDAESANLAMWESGKIESLKPAVKAAQQHGADALVVVGQGVESRGMITSSVGQSNSRTITTGTISDDLFSATSQTTTTGSGSTFSAPMRRGKTRAIAIKFI